MEIADVYCQPQLSRKVLLEGIVWIEKRTTKNAYGCWEWNLCRDRNGYGKTGLSRNGQTHWWRAHRIAWTLAHGYTPLMVLHKCDNPCCCNPEHLFVGTALDNNRDSVAKGRNATGERSGARLHPEMTPRGENQYKAKLSNTIVREARHQYKNGLASQGQLARKYGVNQSTMYEAIHGITWKHVA